MLMKVKPAPPLIMAENETGNAPFQRARAEMALVVRHEKGVPGLFFGPLCLFRQKLLSFDTICSPTGTRRSSVSVQCPALQSAAGADPRQSPCQVLFIKMARSRNLDCAENQPKERF
jgi:hypothetical protein